MKPQKWKERQKMIMMMMKIIVVSDDSGDSDEIDNEKEEKEQGNKDEEVPPPAPIRDQRILLLMQLCGFLDIKKPTLADSVGKIIQWPCKSKNKKHNMSIIVFCVDKDGTLYPKVATAIEAFSLVESFIENKTAEAFGALNF